MVYPKAAAGHFVSANVAAVDARPTSEGKLYAEMTVTELKVEYYKCTPFEGCIGSCTEEEQEQEYFDYEQCPGAIGEGNCATGYMGDRCSSCEPHNSDVTCVDETSPPNGYYRLNERCEPCPCSWFTFQRIMICVCKYTINIIGSIKRRNGLDQSSAGSFLNDCL